MSFGRGRKTPDRRWRTVVLLEQYEGGPHPLPDPNFVPAAPSVPLSGRASSPSSEETKAILRCYFDVGVSPQRRYRVLRMTRPVWNGSSCDHQPLTSLWPTQPGPKASWRERVFREARCGAVVCQQPAARPPPAVSPQPRQVRVRDSARPGQQAEGQFVQGESKVLRIPWRTSPVSMYQKKAGYSEQNPSSQDVRARWLSLQQAEIVLGGRERG